VCTHPNLSIALPPSVRILPFGQDALNAGRLCYPPEVLKSQISGWRSLIEVGVEDIRISLPRLYKLALGGTAVEAGLNAPKGFDTLIAQKLQEIDYRSPLRERYQQVPCPDR
jgi:aspartate ammonia-lyase